jgi:hypothetical protein
LLLAVDRLRWLLDISGIPGGIFVLPVRGEAKGFDGVAPIGVASAFDRTYDRA